MDRTGATRTGSDHLWVHAKSGYISSGMDPSQKTIQQKTTDYRSRKITLIDVTLLAKYQNVIHGVYMLLWIPTSRGTIEICIQNGTDTNLLSQTVSVEPYNAVDRTEYKVRRDDESTKSANDTETNRLSIV